MKAGLPSIVQQEFWKRFCSAGGIEPITCLKTLPELLMDIKDLPIQKRCYHTKSSIAGAINMKDKVDFFIMAVPMNGYTRICPSAVNMPKLIEHYTGIKTYSPVTNYIAGTELKQMLYSFGKMLGMSDDEAFKASEIVPLSPKLTAQIEAPFYDDSSRNILYIGSKIALRNSIINGKTLLEYLVQEKGFGIKTPSQINHMKNPEVQRRHFLKVDMIKSAVDYAVANNMIGGIIFFRDIYCISNNADHPGLFEYTCNAYPNIPCIQVKADIWDTDNIKQKIDNFALDMENKYANQQKSYFVMNY